VIIDICPAVGIPADMNHHLFMLIYDGKMSIIDISDIRKEGRFRPLCEARRFRENDRQVVTLT
jgi:hypothetical protein